MKEVVDMGLVYRGGRAYFYRSVRRDGRVTSEYVASGELALRFAEVAALKAERRKAEAAEEEARRGLLEGEEGELIDYFEQVEDLTRAALRLAGFHCPNRKWRKKRGKELDVGEGAAGVAEPGHGRGGARDPQAGRGGGHGCDAPAQDVV